MNELKRANIDHVEDKLNQLDALIQAELDGGMTEEMSRSAQRFITAMLTQIDQWDDMDAAEKFEWSNNMADMRMASLMDERDMLRETVDHHLHHRLIVIEGNWVITDSKLISPAGFDRQSNVDESKCRAVFDDVACGKPLFVYNMMELRGEC